MRVSASAVLDATHRRSRSRSERRSVSRSRRAKRRNHHSRSRSGSMSRSCSSSSSGSFSGFSSSASRSPSPVRRRRRSHRGPSLQEEMLAKMSQFMDVFARSQAAGGPPAPLQPVAGSASPPGGSFLQVAPAAIPSTSLAQVGASGTHMPGTFPPYQALSRMDIVW